MKGFVGSNSTSTQDVGWMDGCFLGLRFCGVAIFYFIFAELRIERGANSVGGSDGTEEAECK